LLITETTSRNLPRPTIHCTYPPPTRLSISEPGRASSLVLPRQPLQPDALCGRTIQSCWPRTLSRCLERNARTTSATSCVSRLLPSRPLGGPPKAVILIPPPQSTPPARSFVIAGDSRVREVVVSILAAQRQGTRYRVKLEAQAIAAPQMRLDPATASRSAGLAALHPRRRGAGEPVRSHPTTQRLPPHPALPRHTSFILPILAGSIWALTAYTVSTMDSSPAPPPGLDPAFPVPEAAWRCLLAC